MIDTHSHLYYPDFTDDLDAVMERAQEAGVERIITAGVDRATSEQCLEIAARYPGVVFAAIGVHPSEVDKTSEADLLWIGAMAGDPAVVAIGEIGLDVYRGETNMTLQEAVFIHLLQLARQTALPVIVHHRAAGARTIEIIEAQQVTRGVFHCFSEDEAYARRVLAAGLSVSFTGNLTYKNSPLPDLARRLPLERTLLETDAPFMAPAPFRGKRCEPAHTRQVALKQAELHGVELGRRGPLDDAGRGRTVFSGNDDYTREPTMSNHIFTVDEARRAMPLVSQIANDLQHTVEALKSIPSGLSYLYGTDVPAEMPEGDRSRAVSLRAAIESLADEMQEIGVHLKGVQPVLVDFPAVRDGEAIFLCWALGETDIGHWHTASGGYHGRQPL